ncbi:MAG: DUF835 domain-containing protein [Methanomethylovorans sp.]|uniref:DUF835 domain-containing protein n=1 Tax=Methanomethylovorans sp. TaxID=2758717 RepID=UPI000A6C9063|nr:DUF835 domain-containing protein [Methanomethylovorans sp.]
MEGEKRSTILVVDDEEININLLEGYLMHDYDIIPARTGSEALKIIKQKVPDLVLLDVMMPDMNGYDVCDKLKNSPETQFIPIVMVTALSSKEDRIQGISAGADDFLTKPIDRLELKTRVSSLLRIKHLHDSLIEEKKQLKKANEHLYNLMKASPIATLTVDSDQNILTQNLSAMHLLGYGMDELIGSSITTITEGKQLEFTDKKDYEICFLKKNKEKTPMNVSTSVAEDNGSRIMIITLQDRSELRGLFITPVKEELAEKTSYDTVFLENGFIYLMPEHESADGYKIFTNLVKSGTPGLCITRQNPEKIRDIYHLTKTPMIWLTKNKIPGQQVIDPSELFKIFPTIFDFINKVSDGVILLDGLEFLYLFNDVRSVVKLMEQTNDAIMASSSRMILQLDPEILDRKEYHLLKRWMKLLPLEANGLEQVP